MKQFVYGDRQRSFLNTALGRTAHCQYCYLPDLGMGDAPRYISAEDALAMLRQSEWFTKPLKPSRRTVLPAGPYEVV